MIFISSQVYFKYKGYGETVLNTRIQELKKMLSKEIVFKDSTREKTSNNQQITNKMWAKWLVILESLEYFQRYNEYSSAWM